MARDQLTQGCITRVGSIGVNGRRSRGSIYVVVEISQDRLWLEGVVGPLTRGGALGPSGQINMKFARRSAPGGDGELISADAITFAEGWNQQRWLDLLDIWSEYHGVPLDRVPSRVTAFLDSIPAADRPGAWRTLRALEPRT
jgi:hypothetical protein